jgi:hypothetical protein
MRSTALRFDGHSALPDRAQGLPVHPSADPNLAERWTPPLDTAMARLPTSKCLEEVEKYTAGSQTFNFGGYNLYGYQNFPSRMTQSLTAPTSANHATTISELLEHEEEAHGQGLSRSVSGLLLECLGSCTSMRTTMPSTAKTQTFRQRILQIDGIRERRHFLLAPWQHNAILMQDTLRTCSACCRYGCCHSPMALQRRHALELQGHVHPPASAQVLTSRHVRYRPR